MAKTYEKLGNVLKEIDTNPTEKEYTLKELRNRKKFLSDEINDLEIKKDQIQVLIDKALELKVKEE